MTSLMQIHSLLADATTQADSDVWSTLRVILDVVGVIGCIVIILLLLLALTMIPDLFRYLRIKSM